ncbi:hypothetical protein M0R45_019736 [Rubus argutus]|uniref:Uncharacterized protein n=1 Tax=Rubus argutus TaxID=59490 RepID=A0AAW1X8Q2_RUBAR
MEPNVEVARPVTAAVSSNVKALVNPPNTPSPNMHLTNSTTWISLISLWLMGFNVPMDFSPTSGCARGIRCTAYINGQCPSQLRAPGGCNNPCTVFKTDQYCCNSGNCGPTDFSRVVFCP